VPARAAVEAWIVAYERAWRTEGTETLGELFTEDAAYRMSPYEEPANGLVEIAALWEREREGHDEPFEIQPEVVATEGEVAVIRVEVHYLKPGGAEYRDLWIVRFAPDGRCRKFEEWPFWPGRQIAAGRES
jgi:ketosteroid isomerase-like protein